jgi:hypothetical protein
MMQHLRTLATVAALGMIIILARETAKQHTVENAAAYWTLLIIVAAVAAIFCGIDDSWEGK